MKIIMIIDGHDWREKVIYHGADQLYRIERVPGQLVCFTCGYEKSTGVPQTRECHEVWSERTGYPAVKAAREALEPRAT